MKNRAPAFYVRTSTKDQDGQAQLHALRRAAEARGWTDVREYVDLGHSGAKAKRPQLDELRRAARAGEVGAIMVVAFDRLGRNLRNLLDLVEELNASHVELISLRDGVDTTTALGQLFFQINGAFAQFERSLIAERVSAGMRASRARGKPLGRRPSASTPAPEAVAALRSQGVPWAAVARSLGCPVRTARRVHERASAALGAS